MKRPLWLIPLGVVLLAAVMLAIIHLGLMSRPSSLQRDPRIDHQRAEITPQQLHISLVRPASLDIFTITCFKVDANIDCSSGVGTSNDFDPQTATVTAYDGNKYFILQDRPSWVPEFYIVDLTTRSSVFSEIGSAPFLQDGQVFVEFFCDGAGAVRAAGPDVMTGLAVYSIPQQEYKAKLCAPANNLALDAHWDEVTNDIAEAHITYNKLLPPADDMADNTYQPVYTNYYNYEDGAFLLTQAKR